MQEKERSLPTLATTHTSPEPSKDLAKTKYKAEVTTGRARPMCELWILRLMMPYGVVPCVALPGVRLTPGHFWRACTMLGFLSVFKQVSFQHLKIRKFHIKLQIFVFFSWKISRSGNNGPTFPYGNTPLVQAAGPAHGDLSCWSLFGGACLVCFLDPLHLPGGFPVCDPTIALGLGSPLERKPGPA